MNVEDIKIGLIIQSLPEQECNHLRLLFRHINDIVKYEETEDVYITEIKKNYKDTLVWLNSKFNGGSELYTEGVYETDIRILLSAIKEYYYSLLRHDNSSIDSELLIQEIRYNKYCILLFLDHLENNKDLGTIS